MNVHSYAVSHHINISKHVKLKFTNHNQINEKKYLECELYMSYIIIPVQRIVVNLQNFNIDKTLKNTYSLLWIAIYKHR